MSTDKVIEQILQENEYLFPYHYVAKYKPNFCQHFLDSWGINYVSTIEFIISRISKINCESIIDIGCGDGRFTVETSDAFPNAKVVGIDYSQKAISLAKAMNPAMTFINLDITDAQLNEKFEVGIVIEVLEHIPIKMINNFLHGISNILDDTGLLLITVPHSNKPLEYKHFQHFTVESLITCVNEFFEPIEILTFERICFIKKLMDFCLSNNFFILNNPRALNYIYSYYKNNLFYTINEENCQRIFMLAKKRLNR